MGRELVKDKTGGEHESGSESKKVVGDHGPERPLEAVVRGPSLGAIVRLRLVNGVVRFRLTRGRAVVTPGFLESFGIQDQWNRRRHLHDGHDETANGPAIRATKRIRFNIQLSPPDTRPNGRERP